MTAMLATRTRKAFGVQIRESLEDAQQKGIVEAWETVQTRDERQAFMVAGQIEGTFFPGEVADQLNQHGYDIRLGRA